MTFDRNLEEILNGILENTITLDTLKDKWAATFGINTALLSVVSLLTDPNPDDPLNGKIAAVYKTDKKQFIKIAKKHTEEHAFK